MTWYKLTSGLKLAASRSAHDQPKDPCKCLGFEHLEYHFFTDGGGIDTVKSSALLTECSDAASEDNCRRLPSVMLPRDNHGKKIWGRI